MMPADPVRERLKREKEFHDRWAGEIELDLLDPCRFHGCPTTPEVSRAVDCLGPVEGRVVLDLGAGNGESAVHFARGGATVIATDISRLMGTVQRSLARKYGVSGSLRIVTTAGEFISLGDGVCDLVFGQDVLHHCDLDLTLQEVRRVMRDGGKAVFVEPLGHNPFLNLFRRLSPDTRTEAEHPLTMKDLDRFSGVFSRCRHAELQLLPLLLFAWFLVGEGANPNKERYWKKIIDEADRYARPYAFLSSLDGKLFRVLPFLKRYCRVAVIECWK